MKVQTLKNLNSKLNRSCHHFQRSTDKFKKTIERTTVISTASYSAQHLLIQRGHQIHPTLWPGRMEKFSQRVMTMVSSMFMTSTARFKDLNSTSHVQELKISRYYLPLLDTPFWFGRKISTIQPVRVIMESTHSSM